MNRFDIGRVFEPNFNPRPANDAGRQPSPGCLTRGGAAASPLSPRPHPFRAGQRSFDGAAAAWQPCRSIGCGNAARRLSMASCPPPPGSSSFSAAASVSLSLGARQTFGLFLLPLGSRARHRAPRCSARRSPSTT